MAVDEARKHRLFNRLEEVLGSEDAATLMEIVPSMDWSTVATKSDLEVLEHKIVSQLRAEMSAQTRTFVLTTATMTLSVGALAFAAATLA